MIRLLLAAGLLTSAALAQVQLFQFDGSTETSVGQTYAVGTCAPGETITTRFRVFNHGPGPATLQTIAVNGVGFQISALPFMPNIIAAGDFAEFKVAFTPPAVAAGYSANMLLTTSGGAIAVVLRGTAVAAATLSVDGPALPMGSKIDFGTTQTGGSVARTITLTNTSSTPLAVTSITVSGSSFNGPTGIATPITLAGNQSVVFGINFEAPRIDFQASSLNVSAGTLTVDGRSFILGGTGVNPPLPKATLQLSVTTGLSADQPTISIHLASPSQVIGSGTLSMDFQPLTAGTPKDPAIQFMSGPARVTTFTIGVGDTMAKFGASTNFTFQTGTTAGTITFTLTLLNDSDHAALTILPAMVSISATGTRIVNELDISLIGFDNTHTASKLRFTFYNQNGSVLQPGAIVADEGSTFSQYFATAPGGMFLLLAKFPVSGDPTQVAGVDVEITNNVGVTKTQRILF